VAEDGQTPVKRLYRGPHACHRHTRHFDQPYGFAAVPPGGPGLSGKRKWWSRRTASAVAVEETGLLAVRGVKPRRSQVYLPPGYDSDRPKPYPLLIALDGQTMPQWRLTETLQELVTTGQIEPVIVAAVPASPDRIDEYGMTGELDFAGRGRKARAFQDLVEGVIVPWVREHYAVAYGPARTGIFGASMGGLCAFDAAWRRPQVFGTAGVFSGSLWWRGDNSSVAAQQASRLAHRKVRAAAAKPGLRLWFEAGTRDETADRDGNGVIDAIQDTVELIDALEAKGFVRDVDVAYHQVEGGEHHESTWAGALPDFLRWALPPRRG
jgi:enterochelin esterase-like enzyme